MFRSRKYISLMILVAFSLHACASQELKSKRVGDIYKAEKISSRTETTYKISATSPTQITVTERADIYETYRRYYEEIEDVTTKEASWTGKTYAAAAIASVLTLGAILLVIIPGGVGHTKEIVKYCSNDGQIIDGNECSIETKSRKTGSYIKNDKEVHVDSREVVVTSGTVIVTINGRPVEDIRIKPDGTAELDLFKYPELARAKKDVNIDYQYRNAVITATLENAISYAAKQILSEIRSKGWSRVAVVELNTRGLPEGFQESLMEEIELQHTQDKNNTIVIPALISNALKAASSAESVGKVY